VGERRDREARVSLKILAHWERWRVTDGPMRSAHGERGLGAFVVPLRMQVLKVIVSDGAGWGIDLEGEPWEHVSISCDMRCPTWEEMEWVRRQLWDDEDTVIQIHPPLSRYINVNPFVLHLWRPHKTAIPLPPKDAIG
jgi:hypothetical protein